MPKTTARSRDTTTRSPSRDTDTTDTDAMGTKLSPALKALINAPFAKPGPCPAPSKIRDVYSRIAQDAATYKLGQRPWLIISVRRPSTPPNPALPFSYIFS